MTPPIGMDPNAYAAQYARQNGISLDEAKSQLKAQYGDPTQPPQQNFMVAGLQQFQQTSGSTSAATTNVDTAQFSNYSTSGTSSASSTAKTYDSSSDIYSAAYDIYQSGEDFGVRGKEARQLKRQNRKYMDEIEKNVKSFEKSHKLNEYAGNRSERIARRQEAAYDYANKKFQEEHPDIDLATVYYNDRQDYTHSTARGKNLKTYS